MRSEILALDLSRHHRAIHTLTHTSIAKAGQLLDDLIDASPQPVPEHFLDAQEALENSAQLTTTGLASFMTALANQWRGADEVFWTCHATQQEAVVLVRDVEAALLIQPDETTAREFEEDLEAIRKAVEAISSSKVPMPVHATLADQATANEVLGKVLERAMADARKMLAKAKEVVERYAAAARAFERNRLLRKEIEGALPLLALSVAQCSHRCFASGASSASRLHFSAYPI